VIRPVDAVYPPDARARNTTGMVMLRVSIAPDRHVLDAEAAMGPLVLPPAAIAAVRQWQYEAPGTTSAALFFFVDENGEYVGRRTPPTGRWNPAARGPTSAHRHHLCLLIGKNQTGPSDREVSRITRFHVRANTACALFARRRQSASRAASQASREAGHRTRTGDARGLVIGCSATSWKALAMARSPEEMKATMIAGLKEKTGRALDEWRQVLHAAGLTKHKELVNLLKTQHGMTHGYANMIALQVLGADSHTATDAQALVDCQYSGAKANLRPIYDALLVAVKKFGKDAEISPKRAYVSLRRRKQFAIVQPSTSTRVDVGLVLPAVKPNERLEASGTFNAMMTHRIRVGTPSEVDNELVRWLRQAYDVA